MMRRKTSLSERVKITVIEGNGGKKTELFHDKKRTLLHTLREGGVNLPSLCSGIGKCGRCQVRFCGYAPLPTQTDRAVIAPDNLRAGYRLSCMARPEKDCMVESAFEKEQKIDVVVYHKNETMFIQGDTPKKEEEETADIDADIDTDTDIDTDWKNREKQSGRMWENAAVIAAAVDIGTTTIAMQMIEAKTGRILDTYTCLNPQRSYGTDVISRIQAGTAGDGEILQQLVREALLSGIGQMADRIGNGSRQSLKYIIISANTTMGHLLMGYPVETLGKSPFMPIEIKTVKTGCLGPLAILLPGISAFVGGDIVSGLYACGLLQQEGSGIWLFLDLGTNAEMVMGNGNRLVCTAAAAGSAFEGRGGCGATGAERIAAIARLLEKGIVDGTGLLQEPYFETGIEVETGRGGKIRILKEDVRDIQMAKAAVRAGIHFLLEHLEVEGYEEIEKVYIAGGFGFYLDKMAAAKIGLIPFELTDKIEMVGNTSLAGARLAARELLKDDIGADAGLMSWLENAAGKAEVFQLAEEASFERVYVDYMGFEV
jgi:uncharacterized 2Fe-2S/4Fe-4S cluster protein (DUF4445 family)